MVFIEEVSNKREIEDVLNNLHKKTKEELTLFLGEDYKEKTIDTIFYSKRRYLIKLADNSIVGVFGVIEHAKNAAGIFLLTKDKLQGHKINFIRQAKKVINIWEKEYDLLFDCCYIKNEKIKKWLLMLGFKASEHKINDFRVYYKGNKELISELI